MRKLTNSDCVPAFGGPQGHAQDATSELSLRAVLSGVVLGALLAAANVYTGLKTGGIDGGNITASVLAFAFFATLDRGTSPYSARENNLTQTIASSAAVMSFVAGVAGPVPALSLLGIKAPDWAVMTLGVSLGSLGVLIAVVLRRRLIDEEALPFPTGTATAEVIDAMSQGRQNGLRRARTLLYAGLFAALVTWFRDGPAPWIPQALLIPGAIAGVSAGSLSLGVSLSPLMVATGLLTGLRVGVTMLLGSVVAWAVLAPRLIEARIVPPGDMPQLMNWLMWPGAALVLSSSLTSLALDFPAVLRGLRDLRSLLKTKPLPHSDPSSRWGAAHGLLLALVSSCLVIIVTFLAFDMNPLTGVLALGLSFVLSGVCARAAGETDIAPTGTVGGLAQITMGSASGATSLVAGAIVAGCAAQTSQTLWALKAGAKLRASPANQVLGQLLGVVVGAVVVVPVYAVVTAAYGIGTDRMPAPGALSWKATAQAVQGGLSALPSYAPTAALLAVAFGCALTLLGRTRIAGLLPSPVALGIAFLLPLSMSAAMFVGALLAWGLKARFPRWSGEHVSALAGGAIAGESLLAVVLAALIAGGVLSG